MYVVPFMRYSASKNGVTLKPGVVVVHGHWNHIRLLLVGQCKYICMLYHFQVIWRWIFVILIRSLKVIKTGTVRKLGCAFLFVFN